MIQSQDADLNLYSDIYPICKIYTEKVHEVLLELGPKKHNRSLKAAGQGRDFMAHPFDPKFLFRPSMPYFIGIVH